MHPAKYSSMSISLRPLLPFMKFISFGISRSFQEHYFRVKKSSILVGKSDEEILREYMAKYQNYYTGIKKIYPKYRFCVLPLEKKYGLPPQIKNFGEKSHVALGLANAMGAPNRATIPSSVISLTVPS